MQLFKEYKSCCVCVDSDLSTYIKKIIYKDEKILTRFELFQFDQF